MSGSGQTTIALRTHMKESRIKYAYAAVKLAVEHAAFNRDEWIKVAEEIEARIGLRHQKSLKEYGIEELRRLLAVRVEELREKQPETLIEVQSMIDAAASSIEKS
jgi:hypothetical protein